MAQLLDHDPFLFRGANPGLALWSAVKNVEVAGSNHLATNLFSTLLPCPEPVGSPRRQSSAMTLQLKLQMVM